MYALLGVLPIVGQLKCGDKVLESLDLVESLNDHVCESGWIEIAIEGMNHLVYVLFLAIEGMNHLVYFLFFVFVFIYDFLCVLEHFFM